VTGSILAGVSLGKAGYEIGGWAVWAAEDATKITLKASQRQIVIPGRRILACERYILELSLPHRLMNSPPRRASVLVKSLEGSRTAEYTPASNLGSEVQVEVHDVPLSSQYPG
jgi:hypothetical protein